MKINYRSFDETNNIILDMMGLTSPHPMDEAIENDEVILTNEETNITDGCMEVIQYRQ